MIHLALLMMEAVVVMIHHGQCLDQTIKLKQYDH
jgi:hypothetical protein